MSKINTKIPSSNFELIRDRIGEILADEIKNQFTLFGDSDLGNTVVWNSRFIPFAHNEMPAVNVNFFRGDYTGWDAEESLGIYKYSIDCWGAAKTNLTNAERGDSKAMIRMQKILGVCRTILEDTQYRTLNFPPPSLSTTWNEALDIANPMGQDAESVIMGRVIFNVRVNEGIQLLPATMIGGADTKIKLELTDLGYFYKFDNY